MQSASGAFAAAMLLPDQQVAHKVLLTLPPFRADGVTAIPSSYADVSDCVVSTRADSAVTTSTPEGTLLINGYSSMGGTIVLSGLLQQAAGVPPVEGQSIFWLCNPNDVTSPLWGLSLVGMTVTLQEGRWVGGTTPEFVTVGTLIVDTVACSNGTVTLTLIDGRNAIRGAASLPPVFTGNPWNMGLTSATAVDYLFRHSSPGQYLSWPKQRANCVLAVGMRDTLWADVGFYQAHNSTDLIEPTFSLGLNGPALAYTTGLGVSPGIPQWQSVPPIQPTDPFFTEFWLTPNNDDFSVGHYNFTALYENNLTAYPVIEVQVTSTNIVITAVTSAGSISHTWTVAVGFTNRYVNCQITWASGSTAITGVITLDATTHSFSMTAASVRPASVMDIAQLIINGAGTIEGWQTTTEAAGAPSNFGFTPTLILDQSLNPLTALPDVTGKDIWSALQDIAAAEAAVIWIDELNIAHFVNRNTIAAKTSVLTLSSKVNLAALDSLTQLSLVATHVQVPVNAISISDPTEVWGANQIYTIPASGSLVMIVNTQYPALNVATTDSGFFPTNGGLPPSGPAIVGHTYWRGDTQADGLGIPVINGMSVNVVQLSSTALRVTVTNANPYPVPLANPAGYTGGATGQPSLSIGGQVVIPAAAGLTGTTSTSGVVADSQWPPGNAAANPRGDILLPIPANDWVQDLPTAQALGDHYLRDFLKPRPLLRNAVMVSDPRLQLLDRVTVVDPDVNQTTTDALVVGVHLQLGGGSWTRNLDLRQWNPPRSWILGVSRLGVDTYL